MIREYITLPVKTTSDKELISRICREFKHLKKKKKKTNNTISKPMKQTSNESEGIKCKWPINKWKKRSIFLPLRNADQNDIKNEASSSFGRLLIWHAQSLGLNA